jgi:long-chain fatty acid omega-monooxygenase
MKNGLRVQIKPRDLAGYAAPSEETQPGAVVIQTTTAAAA